VTARVKSALGRLLLGWCLVAGVVSWVDRKSGKLSAALMISGYSAILIYGLFFRSREEFRKARSEYLGFAAILAFLLFLFYVNFVR
jgi:hypothetical protein